jgi:hypothetical protein
LKTYKYGEWNLKKVLVIFVALVCSAIVYAGQNPLAIQPYVSGEVRARVGSQESYELTRMRIGMWAYPSKSIEMQFEYNGVTAKTTYAYGRAHRMFGKWELSALAGRHLNPVGYTVPSPHDNRLARVDIAYEPFMPTTYATGIGVWAKYDTLAALRVSSFDSTDASVCLTICGISRFWQDGVGNGGSIRLSEFMHKFGKQLGYSGYELMPYLAYVNLEKGHDPCVLGLDVSLPYPVQLHWLTEANSISTWHSFGASIRYLKRSFIKMMYDGRYETTRVDVSFYASW